MVRNTKLNTTAKPSAKRSSLAKAATSVRIRETPNDVWLTPKGLAKKAIDMIDHREGEKWFDPFRATGIYYSQFPTRKKSWCEIEDGKDFFDFKKNFKGTGVICSNPPYSLLNEVISHSIELNPRVISFLIGVNNFTLKRQQMFEDAGYVLRKMHWCQIRGWFGLSIIVQFERRARSRKSDVTFTRKIYHAD